MMFRAALGLLAVITLGILMLPHLEPKALPWALLFLKALSLAGVGLALWGALGTARHSTNRRL